MDDLSKKVLARLPLAEAVLQAWRTICHPDQLSELWGEKRQRCYESIISFEMIVQLVMVAMSQFKGSGRKAFEAEIASGNLATSVQAVFQKLGRIPPDVSDAFVLHAARITREVFPRWATWQQPKSLAKFELVILDGKAIKRVQRRLKALWGAAGGLLGGRALVAMHWSTGLFLGMKSCEDGDANDVRFCRELVPEVRESLNSPVFWIADAQFCDLTQPRHFTAQHGDHFLVRYHPKNAFVEDRSKKRRKSTDENGRAVIESWGYLGAESNASRLYVRRIIVKRTGDKDLILITDLIESKAYPALDLLWVYGERWSIESLFQKVTKLYGLEKLISTSPKGCLFQFAICLVLSNIIQMILGYIAEGADKEPEEISTSKLLDDVLEQLTSVRTLLSETEMLDYFPTVLTPRALAVRLEKLLDDIWRDRWQKSPPRGPRIPSTRKRTRTHSSVARMIEAHEKRKKRKTSRC
jgi:hypothetical protein